MQSKTQNFFGLILSVSIILAINWYISLSQPLENQEKSSGRNIDSLYTALIDLLKRELYAIDENGYRVYKISIEYFNEYALKWRTSGSRSSIIVTSIAFSNEPEILGGKLITYITDDEADSIRSKLTDDRKKPQTTRRYGDLIIESLISWEKDPDIKAELSSQLFDKLTGSKELPALFNKYFDVIRYPYTANLQFKSPNRFPVVNAINYTGHNTWFDHPPPPPPPCGYDDRWHPRQERITIEFSGVNPGPIIRDIIITDFNPDFYKLHPFSGSDILLKPLTVLGMDGCLKEEKRTTEILSYPRAETIIRYYYTLFFRFDDMLLYVPLPQNAQKINGVQKFDWLNKAENLLQYVIPVLNKEKNIPYP